MKAPAALAITLLALTTIGGAALAWWQHGELIELRAAAMNRDERAEWQKRVWDLEKLSRELQDQIAANRVVNGDPNDLLSLADERSTRDGGGKSSGGSRGDSRGGDRGRESQQFTAVRELMNKPEVQAMVSLQQKAAIEARYAALFKNLNLAPDQVEKLKSLLAERTTTMADIAVAAREQGINPRENPEAFRKLFTDAQNQINQGIKSVVGENGFAQLTGFEQTMPQRNLVNDLQQRLSYTNAPLSAAQAEQMVQILAANTPPRTPSQNPPGGGNQSAPGQPSSGGRGSLGPGGPPGGSFGRGGDMIMGALGPGGGAMIGSMMDGGRGPSAAPVTPGAVAQAQTVLTPTQLDALKKIQQQQQTQQQLQQLVRDTMTANQPTPKAVPASGTTGSGGSKKTRKPGSGGE